MPMEFLHGQPLSPEELELILEQIESLEDIIGTVDPEIRGIVNWPIANPFIAPIASEFARRTPNQKGSFGHMRSIEPHLIRLY